MGSQSQTSDYEGKINYFNMNKKYNCWVYNLIHKILKFVTLIQSMVCITSRDALSVF